MGKLLIAGTALALIAAPAAAFSADTKNNPQGDQSPQSGQFQRGQFQDGQTQSGQTQSGQTQSGQAQGDQTQSGKTQKGKAMGGQMMGGQTVRGQAGSDQQPRETVRPRIQVAPASALLTARVEDVKGIDSGRIEYLMMDARTGTVSFALLSADTRSDELIPVPWRALDVSKSGERVRIKTEKTRLGQAGRYRLDTLAEMTKPAAMTTAYNYWAPLVPADEGSRGQAPADRSAQTNRGGQQSGQSGTKSPVAGNESAPTQNSAQGDRSTQNGSAGQGDTSMMAGRSDRMGQSGKLARSGQSNQSAGASESARGSGEGVPGVPHIFVGRGYVTTLMPPQYRFVEQISGSIVEGPGGEDLGEIAEVMIDVESGRAAYVQVARGGFLGLDEKMVPVPLVALDYVPARNTYRLDMSADAFQNRQAFTPADKPTSVRVNDLDELYRTYEAQPYWREQNSSGQSSRKKG